MLICVGSPQSKRSSSVALGSVQHDLEREILLRRHLLYLKLLGTSGFVGSLS